MTDRITDGTTFQLPAVDARALGKTAVLMGGSSAERAISLMSGTQAAVVRFMQTSNSTRIFNQAPRIFATPGWGNGNLRKIHPWSPVSRAGCVKMLTADSS